MTANAMSASPRTARLVVGTCGLLLVIAAVLAWFVHPAITATLVGLVVVLMSGWQVYRRRAGIEPGPQSVWTTTIFPLTFGLLTVVALNGWIYRIASDAGGESGATQMVVGLITGVVGMASAYGYGRLRAQKARISEVEPADDPVEADEREWFFPQAK